MIYKVPTRLESLLLRYTKRRYLPEKKFNPKTAKHFTNLDMNFFGGGAADMSAYFTFERRELPKNYFNKKELRSGYLLYFVMTNFLKVIFCLNELKALERFKGKKNMRIADIGSGPGTAALACVEYWRENSPSPPTLSPLRPLDKLGTLQAQDTAKGRGGSIEIDAFDQNPHSLHDAQEIFEAFADKNASLKTIHADLYHKNISRTIREKYDIIIASNFLSETGDIGARADLVRSLFHQNLEENGAIIIIEPALRWTTRDLMQLRDNLAGGHPPSLKLQRAGDGPPLRSGINILSPCLHNGTCPMLKVNRRDWCHMYLDWERPEIIKKLDMFIGNKKDYLKFSYLIFAKTDSNNERRTTNDDLWRVVSSPMRSKGKIELLICSKKGLLRVTRQGKHASPLNHDFDKVQRGDLVAYSGEPRLGPEMKFNIV